MFFLVYTIVLLILMFSWKDGSKVTYSMCYKIAVMVQLNLISNESTWLIVYDLNVARHGKLINQK